MGLFDNLFGKKTCVLCGNECGTMHRSKIKDKEYICDDCGSKTSEFVRLSEMDKQTVTEHIQFMQHRNDVYENVLKGKNSIDYPTKITVDGITCYDDFGMLVIKHYKKSDRLFTEVIRYDEIDSYDYYNETTTTDGKETFKEAGVKIKLASAKNKSSVGDTFEKRGLMTHPYINREIKLCFTKSQSDVQKCLGFCEHMDRIFGVKDDRRSLLGFGMSKNEKRDLKAMTDMANLMGGAIKAAAKGESGEELKDQFLQAQNSTADAATAGLAEYSRRADEAENSVR